MSKVKKIWKPVLALLLFAIAAWTLFSYQSTQEPAYQSRENTLNQSMIIWNQKIAENLKYKDLQDDFTKAMEELDASRLELYQHFPLELREEDQIMYVLYLETIFGTEIHFSFSNAQPYVAMRDGSTLMALVLSVNYETTYQGFQDMITYLATDSRITSVNTASIQYDAKEDKAVGQLELMLYLMNSDLLEYLPPDVNTPETGKDNVFD